MWEPHKLWLQKDNNCLSFCLLALAVMKFARVSYWFPNAETGSFCEYLNAVYIEKLIKKLNCSWSRSGGRLIWSNIGQKISSTFQKQGWAGGGGGPCSSARQIDASENFCSQPSQEELKQFRPPTDLWKQKFESNWKSNSTIFLRQTKKLKKRGWIGLAKADDR